MSTFWVVAFCTNRPPVRLKSWPRKGHLFCEGTGAIPAIGGFVSGVYVRAKRKDDNDDDDWPWLRKERAEEQHQAGANLKLPTPVRPKLLPHSTALGSGDWPWKGHPG